jgi:hypothetical protein
MHSINARYSHVRAYEPRLPGRLVVGARAYGIRLLVPHLVGEPAIPDIHGFLSGLHGDGWQIIHLRRQSRVRMIISYVHAARNGFHLSAEAAPWHYEPMTVTVDELVYWSKAVGEWMAAERESLRGIPVRRLIYEYDLAADSSQQATVNRIAGWLGIPPGPARAGVRRQIPDRPLPELITNYTEVSDLLDQLVSELPQARDAGGKPPRSRPPADAVQPETRQESHG